MTRVLSLVLFICLVAADPQLLPLNKFKLGESSIVDGVEVGAQLYLASADDKSLLKNINITSGNKSITLDQINSINTDGTAKYFLLDGNLSIITSNKNTVTANLTGNIFVTSKEQANDPNFSVFVIKDQHIINTNDSKYMVILNTWNSEAVDIDEPNMISYVTIIDQHHDTNLYFQWGIPSANWQQETNRTFFRAPLMLSNGTESKQVFFDNFEPLQIALNAWYFQATGPIDMKIEKKYVSNHNYTTTATKTTGLIMNSGIYREHVVNFLPDVKKYGVSGVYYAAFHEEGDIGVYLETATGQVSYNAKNASNAEDQWSFYVEDQAYSVKVNTTNKTPGTFFVQYFSIPGADKPVTTTLLPTKQATTSVTGKTELSTATAGTSTEGSTTVPVTTQRVASTTTAGLSTKASYITTVTEKVSTTTIGTSTKGTSNLNKMSWLTTILIILAPVIT